MVGRYWVVVIASVGWGLACAGPAPPDPEPVTVAPEPAPEQPAPVRKRKVKVSQSKHPDNDNISLARVYTQNCHYVVLREDEMAGGYVPECEWRPFDQNCAPDEFGCWGDSEECVLKCDPPCTSCQERCADTCDSCKDACPEGDGACSLACGQERASCRETCMAARSSCEGDCSAAFAACDRAAKEEIAQKCPDCAALGQCLWQVPNDCREKYPNNAEECFTWCYVP